MRVRRDPRGRSRRAALILLIGPAVLVAGLTGRARLDGSNPGFSFKEVAASAGLTAVTVFGGKDANRYLLETTGTGVALFDYDADGWLDLFVVNYVTFSREMKRACFSASSARDYCNPAVYPPARTAGRRCG